MAVISGDTRYNQNVIKYGAGADLLVHEVAIARPELMSDAYIRRIMAHHTTAREAGMVFEQTKPKLAVYTHLVFLASPRIPPASIAELVAETRQTYRGPLEVGEDLMCFEIGETVTVRRHGLAGNVSSGIDPARSGRHQTGQTAAGVGLSDGLSDSETHPGLFTGEADGGFRWRSIHPTSETT